MHQKFRNQMARSFEVSFLFFCFEGGGESIVLRGPANNEILKISAVIQHAHYMGFPQLRSAINEGD
jgi:hypothetical protein